MSKSVHPDIRRFKIFVKNHPYVLRDVKSGEKTLQDLFEEYMLFGEEDEIWETYRLEADERVEKEEKKEEEQNADDEKNTAKESIGVKDIVDIFKKMNMNDLQKNLAQISGVLASVQELLMQFKQTDVTSSSSQVNNDPQPSFSYRDD